MKWLQLAWRNILRNPRRTALTISFIGLSLAALIFVDGLIRGMSNVMVGMLTDTLSGHAQIHHPTYLDQMDNQHLISKVQNQVIENQLISDSKVAYYAPRMRLQSMVSSSGGIEGAQIYGLDVKKESHTSKIQQSVIEGQWLTNTRDIILGYKLAKRLNAELGDRIVVTTPDAATGEPAQGLYRLSGLVRFNQRAIDQGMGFVSLESAQQLIQTDGVHEWVIKLHIDHQPSESMLWQQTNALNFNSADSELKSWQQLFPQMYSLLDMQNYSTAIIAIILFTLAGLGIINTLFMSIYERYYEFGVLKSIGTTPVQIAMIIVLEAILLGLLSIIAGIIVGTGLEAWVAKVGIQYEDMELVGLNLIDPIRPVFHLDQFTKLPSWVLLLTFFTAIYPAIHAARIVPAKALRKSL